ncbi:hypothetical protein ABVK25_010140 [Lepraria finkii]|uniref:Protein kinase domain-containing protein n=1 Tax=Lepraria finkii TaxID=1340010 RepID=A0ABR4AXX2_9LECA
MASSDKRSTIFPGNSSIDTSRKRQAETGLETLRLSASKIPKAPRFVHNQQRPRPRPPSIPLPVNLGSSQYSSRSRFTSKPKQVPVSYGFACVKGDPWQECYAILKEDQGGQVTIAHKQEVEHPMIAIRETKIAKSSCVESLAGCLHENIVSLFGAYIDNETIFFVYECMDVTLAEIQSTPYGGLASYQIAVVCKEVLKGIQHIHTELKILHGSINTNSIMVDRDGNVKLANIGPSMLRGAVSSHHEQEDLRALGLLMVQLMELDTSLQAPDSLELKNPDIWDEQIVKFLKKTASCSRETLQEVRLPPTGRLP